MPSRAGAEEARHRRGERPKAEKKIWTKEKSALLETAHEPATVRRAAAARFRQVCAAPRTALRPLGFRRGSSACAVGNAAALHSHERWRLPTCQALSLPREGPGVLVLRWAAVPTRPFRQGPALGAYHQALRLERGIMRRGLHTAPLAGQGAPWGVAPSPGRRPSLVELTTA